MLDAISERARQGQVTDDDVRWIHEHYKDFTNYTRRLTMPKLNRKSTKRLSVVKVEEILDTPIVVIDASEREGEYGMYLLVKAFNPNRGLFAFMTSGMLMEDLQAEAGNIPLACRIVTYTTKSGRKGYRLEDVADDTFEELLEAYEQFEQTQ